MFKLVIGKLKFENDSELSEFQQKIGSYSRKPACLSLSRYLHSYRSTSGVNFVLFIRFVTCV